MPLPPDYAELAAVKPPRPPWEWPPMRVPYYWEYGEKPMAAMTYDVFGREIGTPHFMSTTAGPSVEPEPSRTVPSEPFVPNDDPLCPMPLPLAGSWQCGGCGRIYNMTVNSCDCQAHRWTRNSDKFEIYPGSTTTLPKWGTFTGVAE